MSELNQPIKRNQLLIDPRAIEVVEGFNSRCCFGNIEELAEQIKEYGILNALTVYPYTSEDGTEKYRLVDGERRYRAVMLLLSQGVDIARVPVNVLSKSTSMEEMIIQQGLRNEGKPFTYYELGVLTRTMMNKFGYSMGDVAKKLGKNLGFLHKCCKVLELKPELAQKVRDDVIGGADLERMMDWYGSEDKVLKELEKMQKHAMETRGETKISLKKDATGDDTPILFKNSKEIAKGIEKLLVYLNRFNEENKTNLHLNNLDELLKLLKTNNNIKDTLNTLNGLYGNNTDINIPEAPKAKSVVPNPWEMSVKS